MVTADYTDGQIRATTALRKLHGVMGPTFIGNKHYTNNIAYCHSDLIMATEALRAENPESIEALSREAESLKNRLAEEKAKLNDVDCKWASVQKSLESRSRSRI